MGFLFFRRIRLTLRIRSLLKIRRCEHCGGNLMLEKYLLGDKWLKCLQCGRRVYLAEPVYSDSNFNPFLEPKENLRRSYKRKPLKKKVRKEFEESN